MYIDSHMFSQVPHVFWMLSQNLSKHKTVFMLAKTLQFQLHRFYFHIASSPWLTTATEFSHWFIWSWMCSLWKPLCPTGQVPFIGKCKYHCVWNYAKIYLHIKGLFHFLVQYSLGTRCSWVGTHKVSVQDSLWNHWVTFLALHGETQHQSTFVLDK